MKITYTENPLLTRVELDDHDKEVLGLKIRVEELQERLAYVNLYLSDERFSDLEKAKRESDPHYFEGDDEGPTALDRRVELLLNSYVEELLGEHAGDCVKQPCSCMKCRAEDILGINTVELFSGKGCLYCVRSAFGYIEDGQRKQRSLPEALEYLRTYKVTEKVMPESWKPHYTQEYYDACVVRWEKSAGTAYECLQKYAAKHFSL